MSFQIRLLGTALVLVTLAAGAAQALPLPGPSRPAAEKAGFLDAAWDWTVAFFHLPAIRSRSSVGPGDSEAGGMMDPDGTVTQIGGMNEPADTKAGGMMDPDGNR